MRKLSLAFLILAAMIAFQQMQRTRLESSRALIRSSAAPLTLPIYSGCANASPGRLTFQAQARVPRAFAQSPTDVEAVARAQSRYLTGYFNHDESLRPLKVHLLSEPRVHVLEHRDAHYGRALFFEPFPGEDWAPYPKEFKRPVQLTPSSPAVEVSYEASADVVVCRSGLTPASSRDEIPKPLSLDLKLPVDPFLAYWDVPKSDRRELSFQNTSSFTNPCADSEMADLRYPSMYWYAWNPDAHGTDKNGRSFDCRINADVRTETIPAKFEETPTPPKPFQLPALSRKDVIQARFIYGFLENENPDATLKRSKTFLKSLGSLFTALPKLDFATLQKQRPDLDSGLLAALYDVKSLESFASLSTLESLERDSSIELRIKGHLHHSNKELELHVFIGCTDQPRGHAQHGAFLKDAFNEADIITYVGHSGMGANMDLRNFPGVLEPQPGRAKPRYQLLAILGCYTTQYFTDGIYQSRAAPDQTTDLLLVASRRYLVTFSPKLLGALDDFFSGDAASVARLFKSQTQPGEMIALTRHESR